MSMSPAKSPLTAACPVAANSEASADVVQTSPARQARHGTATAFCQRPVELDGSEPAVCRRRRSLTLPTCNKQVLKEIGPRVHRAATNRRRCPLNRRLRGVSGSQAETGVTVAIDHKIRPDWRTQLPFSFSDALIQATPCRPAWADAGARQWPPMGRGAADRGSA